MGSFQTVDLERIERAIASGALVVRYDDGRQVTYRSLEELLQARDLIARCLAPAAPARKTMAHGKGVEATNGSDTWSRS